MPQTSHRFKIKPGTPVLAIDDEVGRVDRLIVSSRRGEVRGLLVQRGLILKHDVVVPIEAVVDANEERVRLYLTADEINKLPAHVEKEYVPPGDDWRSPFGDDPQAVLFRVPRASVPSGLEPSRAGQTAVAFGGKQLRAHQKVVCLDGDAGEIELVLLEPERHRVSHIVVRHGLINAKHRVVPVEWIHEIAQDRIHLDLTREELEEFPEYRPDDQIVADVLDELWYRSGLSSAEVQFVWVEARDGIVDLYGQTKTEAARAKAGEVAAKVPGVQAVVNNIEPFDVMVRAASKDTSPTVVRAANSPRPRQQP